MSGFKPYDASSSGSGGGGGGVFQPESRVDTTIATGQTGDLITITAPTGKTIKVTYLFSSSTTTRQAGISLIVNGNTLIDQQSLAASVDQSVTGSFYIGMMASSNPTTIAGYYRIPEVYCTSFVVNKNAGNTARSIYIVYEIGEVK